MGKSNSKLKQEVVEDLTRKTYCEYRQAAFFFCLSLDRKNTDLCENKAAIWTIQCETLILSTHISCCTVSSPDCLGYLGILHQFRVIDRAELQLNVSWD